MKNGSNKEQEVQPMMILTIDIGNGHVDKLQLFDLNNIEQETYDFCVKNKLDFNTMQEINNQIQNVLKDKQIEEDHEIDNEFQEIKEEEDEKNTENNINEVREQESIIITNSNEMDTNKENKNKDLIIENNTNNDKNIINSNNENKHENNINTENKKKKNNNPSIRSNKSSLSINNVNSDNKQIKKQNKPKKKNIKDNIKEAIAMAKEKTRINNINNNNNINNKLVNKNYNEINKDNYQFLENNNNSNNYNNNNEENNFDENKPKKIEKIEKKIEKMEMQPINENLLLSNINKQPNNIVIINNNNINNINDHDKDNDNFVDKKEVKEIIQNNENEKEEEEKNNNVMESNEIKEDEINKINGKEEKKEIEKKDEILENLSPLKNGLNNYKENEINNFQDNINNITDNKNNNDNDNSKEIRMGKNKNKSTTSNNGSHVSGFNPGRDLYERGIKFKENEKEKLEALKKNLEVDEDEDNTFIPKINRLSQTQKDRIKEKGLECTNPNIINNYKQYREEKMEILKKKTDEEFFKVCTFKPVINRSYSSTKVMKNKINEDFNNPNDKNNNINNNINGSNNNTNINNMKNETRFDKLYNYRIGYKENKNRLKEKIYNEFSFKPQINENSSFYKLNLPFNERLQTYSNKSKENMMKIQQVYERELGYDESFKPHLNNKKNKKLLKDREEFFLKEAQKYNINVSSNGNTHNNSNNNNNNNNNINIIDNNNINSIDPYTKLYLYGKKYQQEKIFLAEKYYQNQNKSPQFCESTEEIINKKKEKSFKQIFKLLDGDEDSKISYTHMNISKLPPNIIKILQPIFNELKEENETLNELEFIFVCEQLYISLPWTDKRELTTFEDIAKKNIKKEKILKEKNNFSFKPKINKRNYSFENPTKLINDNNESNNINYYNNNDKNPKNIMNIYNNYYIQKNKINNNNFKEKNILNKEKNSQNQINNRVNYFNVRASHQNNNNNYIIKKTNNEFNFINNMKISNNNHDKFSILKNVNINIIGKNTKNTEKNAKIATRKINYDDFINVKN